MLIHWTILCGCAWEDGWGGRELNHKNRITTYLITIRVYLKQITPFLPPPLSPPHTHPHQVYNMALNIDHLGDVQEELYEARTKWYDISLALKVPVTTLDSIGGQFDNHSDKLRETLKVWLKTATEPTWQNVVDVLKRRVVGEPKLASDIEAKHCTTAETGQASGQTIPEVQQPQLTTRATELHTLQQALQDSRELRIKDQQLQDSQRRIDTLQQELKTKDKQLQDSQRRILTLQQELQDSQRRTHTLRQELQDSQRRTHTLQQELQTKDQQLQDSQRQFQQNLLQHEQANKQLQDTVGQLRRDLQQAVEEKQAGERRLRELNQQLLKTPQVGARPHETITPPRPELQQPQEEQHATRDRQLQPMKRPGPLPQKTVMQQKSIADMRWQRESKAPEKMYRGSAAADSNMAYFHGDDSTTVHSYDSNTREWRRLPAAPHTRSTLVVVHRVLTMVGGQISGGATDSLLSLMGEGRDIKWLPNLPAMPTKRYWTAAVCSGRSLIVAGGYDGHNELSTVEVLDTDTRQWSIASALTHPFYDATISICGERLYMLGGFDQTSYWTRSVLSCSVPELLQSCQPQPLAGKLRTAPANQSAIWRHVADAPHYMSSCATLCGQLVAVGGYEAHEDSSAITGYNETTDSWEAIGHMPTARCWALVVILNGKMMVVGGKVGGLVVRGWYEVTETDVVEILC